MVMPFGRKATSAPSGAGPAEVDFDRLWDLAYVPVIKSLGYEPVRADQETGSMIIAQMLERLYFSDLVLADMTIPNGNVYYEVGIRHAAKEGGSVLLAADWSRQLFDVAQMRTGRYPLPEGNITEATAELIKPALKQSIDSLRKGRSPMHECIDGYPHAVNVASASTMKDWMLQQAAFQARLRAVRAAPKVQRLDLALALADELLAVGGMTPLSASHLVRTMRDCAQDTAMRTRVLDLMARLPKDALDLPEVAEQHALLMCQAGDVQGAIKALLTVIELHGPSPERLGLLAGRHKRLLGGATDPEERQRYLMATIKYYEEGMDMDLNGYYCSSNLPRLYRQRGRARDEALAQRVLNQVLLACERDLRRGVSDEWLRPTLLNAAFDAGDADKAEELLDTILDEGLDAWKLDVIHEDLDKSAEQNNDVATKARLKAVLRRLRPQG
jgi:hypothetical protein